MKTPTKEQLEMYIKLQKKFKEVLGEIKAGEMIYRKCTVFGEELDSKIWSEDKRIEIVRIEQVSSAEGYYYCVSKDGESRFLTSKELLEETTIRIPTFLKLIECFNKNVYENTTFRGIFRINGNQWIAEIYDERTMYEVQSFVANDITTAVLKALCEQEGV